MQNVNTLFFIQVHKEIGEGCVFFLICLQVNVCPCTMYGLGRLDILITGIYRVRANIYSYWKHSIILRVKILPMLPVLLTISSWIPAVTCELISILRVFVSVNDKVSYSHLLIQQLNNRMDFSSQCIHTVHLAEKSRPCGLATNWGNSWGKESSKDRVILALHLPPPSPSPLPPPTILATQLLADGKASLRTSIGDLYKMGCHGNSWKSDLSLPHTHVPEKD